MSEKILTQAERNYTADEQLKSGARANGKSEITDSRASSSRRHNLIASNATIAIGSRVRGHKCEVYVNSMRVRLGDNQFCYPDVVIVAGEPTFDNRAADVLTNPTVVVEIYSKDDRAYNKSEKLERYLSLDSVRDCLFVKEEEMRVEHYAKQTAKQWMYRIYDQREDVINLESITCKVNPSELYAQVKFD